MLLGFCGTANNVTGLGAGQTQLCEGGSASKSYINLSSKTATGTSTTFSITIASSTADWELILLPLTPLNATFLPIELTKFNVDCSKGQNAVVTWTTATEKNNDYFSLDRSSDGFTFETIADIKGSGNSNQVLNYFYVDERPIFGDSYYRLSQTDFNGKRTFFSILYSYCEQANFIYPNPTTGIINITKSNLLYAEILGPDGVKLNCVNSGVIDLTGMKDGFYFIKVKSDTGEKQFKIVKQ